MIKKLILATAVLCAGCGIAPITEEEAVDVLRELTRLGDGWDLFNEGDTRSVSCPSGGSATFELLRRVERGTYERVWSIRPATCAVTSAGTPFTVDGDPDLQETWANFDDSSIEFRMNGGFIWDRDSEGGSMCEVSLVSENVVVDEGGHIIDGTVTGSLCGLDVTFGIDRVMPTQY